MVRQRLLVSVFGLFILYAEGFIQRNPKLNLRETDECANPLIFTDYIESKNYAKARRLSRVHFTEQWNITSHAGFFTVNKEYDTNMFTWYFPAMSNATDAPVILYLQSGEIKGSTVGMFFENGPLTINGTKFCKRDQHLALDHHVIYIDNPVGVGYSFTNNDEGYSTNGEQVGENLYSSLVQFFQIFPELQDNKFFVVGMAEAGGMYGPALAQIIHRKNPTATLKINLKGIAIASGWSDPVNQLGLGDILYHIGIIDWNMKPNYFDVLVNNITDFLQEQHWSYAYEYLWSMRYMSFYLLGNDYNLNYNKISNEIYQYAFVLYTILTSFEMRTELHIGHLPFNIFTDKSDNLLIESYMKSSAPILSELLEHYDVLTYNGQLDVILGYPLTVDYLRKLNFSGSADYETAKRHIWRVDGEVAGYVKKAGRLVETMVRNAGYMISWDQPKWTLDLITRFTHGKPFY